MHPHPSHLQIADGAGAAQPPAWAYQAPEHPHGHPRQCYYRGQRHPLRGAQVFRFADDACAEISLRVPGANIELELSPAALTQLRDALNDALVDIQALQAEQERAAAFARIQDELRDAADDGAGAPCYYCHPDVHYVPPGQVAAKVAELEAAGAARYIVLPEPALGGGA